MKSLAKVVLVLMFVSISLQISAIDLSGSMFWGEREDTTADYNIGYGIEQADWLDLTGSFKRRAGIISHRNYNVVFSHTFMIGDTKFGITPRFKYENWDDAKINYTRFDFRFSYSTYFIGLAQVLQQPWKPEFEEFWNEKFLQKGLAGFHYDLHLNLVEDLPLILSTDIAYLTDDFDTFNYDHRIKLTAKASKIVSFWINCRMCDYDRYEYILKSGITISLFDRG